MLSEILNFGAKFRSASHAVRVSGQVIVWRASATMVEPGTSHDSGDAATMDTAPSPKCIGEVYSFGGGKSGALGHGTRDTVHTPKKVPIKGGNVVALATGSNFCVVLLSDGTMRVWGSGKDGRLGLGNEDDALSPVPLKALLKQPIVEIAAGERHAFARASDGRVWGWGHNAHAALGVDSSASPVTTPLEVRPLPRGDRRRSPACGCGVVQTVSISGSWRWWVCTYCGRAAAGVHVHGTLGYRTCRSQRGADGRWERILGGGVQRRHPADVGLQ